MPSDLAEQIPYIRRILEALRIPILQFPGFEADDVIGALATRAVRRTSTSSSSPATRTCCNSSTIASTCYNPGEGRHLVRPVQG